MGVEAIMWNFDPGPVLASPTVLLMLGSFDAVERLVYKHHVLQEKRKSVWEVGGWAILIATRGKDTQTFTSVVLWEERERWKL